MLIPTNSIKVKYTLDPKWITELYPTNKFNISNVSKLEMTIPHFKKYNTRGKYQDLKKTPLFFELILNRLEFYTPELRTGEVVDTDIKEYKFLIGKKVYFKNKNIGKNRHNFNADNGTFEVFINDIETMFGYREEDGSVKALNDSIVCDIPLGEPFEETTLFSLAHLSEQELLYHILSYNSMRHGKLLDLFNIKLNVLDVSHSILKPNCQVGDKVVHITDYVYRSNIAEVSRKDNTLTLFVLNKSIVAKEKNA